MKYKKLILILSLFIITFAYIINPLVEEKILETESYEDKIIRFHIRANSDKEEDQGLKLKIRDEILKEMKVKFKDTVSLDESRKVIKANMKEMKYITENVIREEGEDYSVEVTLGQDNFPTRKYGNLVFPAGDYETLLITLGEGKGQNWWCVMFPPLCFVDITHSVAYNLEKELVSDMEVQEETQEDVEQETQEEVRQETQEDVEQETQEEVRQETQEEVKQETKEQVKQETQEEVESTEKIQSIEELDQEQDGKEIGKQQPKLKLKWKIVDLFKSLMG